MGRKKTSATPTVPETHIERSIYFYHLDPFSNEGKPPVAVDPLKAAEKVMNLVHKDRYWTDPYGALIYCWVDGAKPTKIRLGSIRKKDLPQVEEDGNLTPLDISRKSGLAEITHIRLFTERNATFAAADFNFYGPRAGKLNSYFQDKASELIEPVVFRPIFKRDVLTRMANYSDLKLFRLRIKGSYATKIMQADKTLGEALRAQVEVGEADEVEVVLRAMPYNRRSHLGSGLLKTARRILGFADVHENATDFEIKGFDQLQNKIELLDLLNDQFVVKKIMLRENPTSRAVESDHAYEALEDAYNSMRSELLICTGATRHDKSN